VDGRISTKKQMAAEKFETTIYTRPAKKSQE